MRLSGSAAFAEPVSLRFIPVILLQNDSLREPPSGCGLLMSWPSAFRDARPFAFNPPSGFFPSFRVQAGDFGIGFSHFLQKLMEVVIDVFLKSNYDLVVGKVNIEVLNGTATVNFSLPTRSHEQNRTGICRLKAQEKV